MDKDSQKYNRLHKIDKPFISDDFLLHNEFAKTLYHDYASELPIIDYHNHLSPKDITENRQFTNCTQIWLGGDHYKWRAMRTLGVDEHYITGGASDKEKFFKWAETVPYTLRNPLFHWTHLELKRYFGIDRLLTPQSASEIYEATNENLQADGFRVRPLLDHMNVAVVCSTDDPVDTLAYHHTFAEQSNTFKLLPSFRPDKAYAVENPAVYSDYLKKLGEAANIEITRYTDLIIALRKRMAFFNDMGCRQSDHGLEQLYHFELGHYAIDKLFLKVLDGSYLTHEEIAYFKFETLVHLCKSYHEFGWIQQFHLGALRNTNTRMLKTLGPDTGFDSIGDFPQALQLSKFFDLLDRTDQLTKTIVYNLNPADNEVMASMIGNFNDGSIRGKMQFGSAWWFLDQKDGMEKQLNSLSNLGLLSCFIGMLTDSRSFLSFPRHEYFRRVLCNLIGKDVQNGELPSDEKWLGKMVSDICYHNAKAYFNF
ncbi:MAG: glucuronate isomerase [Saonia sp.]